MKKENENSKIPHLLDIDALSSILLTSKDDERILIIMIGSNNQLGTNSRFHKSYQEIITDLSVTQFRVILT